MIAMLVAAMIGDCKADVKFNDGSRVVMSVMQKSIALETRYGKLTIPCDEIISIDFGVHQDGDTLADMVKLLARLSGSSHKDRDEASKSLVGLQHAAHHFLVKHSGITDFEAKKRVEKIIQSIAESSPRQLLERSEEDVVVTRAFSVSGKIVGEKIDAECRLFGKQPILFSEAYSILFTASANKTITLCPSDDVWFNTGVKALSRRSIDVQASGQVDLYPQQPGQYMAGPSGYTSTGKNSSYAAGALIGRIGDKGGAFMIGASSQIHPSDDGDLYLMIVRSPWDNSSSGSYNVKISVRQ